MLTETEIDRIAAMTNALRPDWPAASIRTLIAGKLANRARRDLAVALAWVACESQSQTPARVLEPGPWWRAATIEAPNSMTRQPPRREQECRRHPGEWADACRPCGSDRLTDQPEAPVIRPDAWTEPTDFYRAVRSQLIANQPPDAIPADRRTTPPETEESSK